MDCIECKTPNPDENRYCGKCGAELGHTMHETLRRRNFRDRQATEMEITASVVERLLKWTKWLGSVLALILLAFGFFIGNTWLDVRAAVARGQSQIEGAVADGKKQISSASSDISALSQSVAPLKKQYAELQSDASKYTQLIAKVEKLQKELSDAEGKWQQTDLRVRSLHVGEKVKGFPTIGFGALGCPNGLTSEFKFAFCATGSPPMLYEVTHQTDDKTHPTDLRPVASLSTIGFRDASTEPKSNCSSENRGTLYVEKGADKRADAPFLCAKKSDGTYAWISLGTVP